MTGILSGSGVMGYIIIGLIAFVLGVTITVTCFSIRASKKPEDKENSQ